MEKTPLPGSELDFCDEAPVTDLKVEVGHPKDLAETESGTSDTVESEYESYTLTDTGDKDSVLMLALEEVDQFMEPDPELTAQEKILRVLHLVSCKNLTEYDPRQYDFVCTRFSRFNIALFDLDEESEAMNGPPLQQLSCSQWHSTEDSSLNVISVKITESDVGYPIDVFGTVIARDEVDYKCISLYRRERDESQRIHSAEDMLTLTGPSRGFAASDGMFFEINLMYKGDGATDDTQLSKGVAEYHNEPFDLRPVTVVLSSWLSRVELLCLPVPYPTAAVIEVKILNGNRIFIGKIFAWSPGNDANKMLLYSHDCGADHALIGDGHRVTLARNLVAVPIGEDIALHICFMDHGGGEVNVVKISYPQEEMFCEHGSYELQLKVEWRSMLSMPMADAILKRWASVPVRHLSSQKLYMSSP
ncbi:uncharacterized protein LOC100825485 [Brachypodium distachyon]|uniref:DUF6598 domain-containing protein n=1 Tax=Brachypodium distachyon TaxID=15368 RepID=I1GRI2_BRADI|nr:uncharacterized protein LOC100825485 [Brachypodium distachyon]KQK14829.1 hypothetical protein BRADI_1g18840v3 [Brachypodium distachyon]PNT74616.1 hypothetical protein BRADI_1g18840v3 [Brachypodium distachyon]|eukprot:XP_003562519.2 uncharacterized protein LOC100825485 [Brachypodium distachyon]